MVEIFVHPRSRTVTVRPTAARADAETVNPDVIAWTNVFIDKNRKLLPTLSACMTESSKKQAAWWACAKKTSCAPSLSDRGLLSVVSNNSPLSLQRQPHISNP
jgi:hypothetical protein